MLSLNIADNELDGNNRCLNCFRQVLLESKLKEIDVSRNCLGNKVFEEFIPMVSGSALTRVYCGFVGINCILLMNNSKFIRSNI